MGIFVSKTEDLMSQIAAWNKTGKRKAPAKVSEDRSDDGMAARRMCCLIVPSST